MKVKYLELYKYAILLSKIHMADLPVKIDGALIISDVKEFLAPYIQKVENKRVKIKELLEKGEIDKDKSVELMGKFLETKVTLKEFTEDLYLPKKYLLDLEIRLSVADVECIKLFLI